MEGFRDKETQDRYFAEGRSKLKFPHGKHNVLPSKAVDMGFYPVRWPNKRGDPTTYAKSLASWYMFGMFVIETGRSLGLDIRWGGDWDSDWDIHDQSFDDLPHFEYLGKL
jgi:peptidoglycan L-alanyl-D-glutamate endopeptidase CwlK